MKIVSTNPLAVGSNRSARAISASISSTGESFFVPNTSRAPTVLVYARPSFT
ncbi:MAG: hypothetical protein ACRDXC_06340 [Acidimicrobiales bacterium]